MSDKLAGMAKDSGKPFTWSPEPTTDDLEDAGKFLTLLGIMEPVTLDRTTGLVFYPAKDLLRASGQYGAGLPRDNAGVAKWLKRMCAGEQIPLVLLIGGELVAGRPLLITEGYHRVCAAWHLAEDTEVGAYFLA